MQIRRSHPWPRLEKKSLFVQLLFERSTKKTYLSEHVGPPQTGRSNQFVFFSPIDESQGRHQPVSGDNDQKDQRRITKTVSFSIRSGQT